MESACMAIRCARCGEQLDDDARFCGMCGATMTDRNIGRVINGRYVLRELVGAGSLGIVYRAEQLAVGRKVALKLLPADRAHNAEIGERFRREGEVLCQLRSQHTVTTYEFDREPDGTLYIVMELSAGRRLADVLAAEAPLDWWRVLRILIGLCDSLGEAHALGVVHRDIKPENILLEERAANHDFVKLLDFGLAKLLLAPVNLSPVGQTVGTLAYCSPEQLMQRPIDARSDLYALGVLGFHMITGMHPLWNARSVGDLVAATIQAVPPPASAVRPGIPADVDAIFARLLEKDPDRRFPDTAALAAMLRVALAQLLPEGGDTMRESELEVGDDDVLG